MDLDNCLVAKLSCFFLASVYVGSLYIWKSDVDRNHPKTVAGRFLSAFLMLFVAPFIVYNTLMLMEPKQYDLLTLLGLRWEGILPSIILPILLTSVLFLGSITSSLFDGSWKDLFSAECWRTNLQDILWIRNHIVAPISEEFTFRACMLPQLLKCYASTTKAIIVSPLFFGVGHLHHMIEYLRMGWCLEDCLKISCFQFIYTTLFGMYASFLFLRTGHIAAPCVAHAFCNMMGFPDFGEIGRQQGWKRITLAAAFVSGLVGWYFLLWPLTEPALYSNASY